MNEKVRVDLSGAAQTMSGTCIGKALDADSDRPSSATSCQGRGSRLDYDFREIGMTAEWAPLITVRTAQYDISASDSWPFTRIALLSTSDAVWTAGCSG